MSNTRWRPKIISLILVAGIVLSGAIPAEAKRGQPERFRSWSETQDFVEVRPGEFRFQSGSGLGEYRFRLNPLENLPQILILNPRRGQHGLSEAEWNTFNSIRFTILNFVMKVLELPFLPIGTTVMIGSTIGFRKAQDADRRPNYQQDRRLSGVQLHRKRAIRSILKAVDSGIYLARESIARTRTFVLPLVIGFENFNLGIQLGYHLPIGASRPRLIMDTLMTAPTGGTPLGTNSTSAAGGNLAVDGLYAALGVTSVTLAERQGVELTVTSNQGSASISSLTSALMPLLLGGDAANMPMSFNTGSTTLRTRVYIGELRNHFVVFKNYLDGSVQTLRVDPLTHMNANGHDLSTLNEGSPSAQQCRATFK